MDKGMAEHYDQILSGLASRDDILKLRQETAAHLRKLTEEHKSLILGWVERIRAEMEDLKRGSQGAVDPLRGEVKEEIKNLEQKMESSLAESVRTLTSSFDKIREEASSILLQSKTETGAALQLIQEEGRTNLVQSREEMIAKLDRLGESLGNLGDRIRKTAEEIGALDAKIKEGFNEVKEELGSMIKFSYADLEKRFHALEARVKALEKLVLP